MVSIYRTNLCRNRDINIVNREGTITCFINPVEGEYKIYSLKLSFSEIEQVIEFTERVAQNEILLTKVLNENNEYAVVMESLLRDDVFYIDVRLKFYCMHDDGYKTYMPTRHGFRLRKDDLPALPTIRKEICSKIKTFL